MNKRNYIKRDIIELSQSSECISSSSFQSCQNGDSSLCENSTQAEVASHSDTELCSDCYVDVNEIKEEESKNSKEHSNNQSLLIKEVDKYIVVQERLDNISGSKQEILHTLLVHYKTISIFNIKFSWLGFHKIYGILLVACNTYITDPLTRINVMSSFLLVIAVLNTVVKPYKRRTANMTSTLSYSANICIAIINVCQATLQKFDCNINCLIKTQLVTYLGWTENFMLIYVPVGVFCVWLVKTGIQTSRVKAKL